MGKAPKYNIVPYLNLIMTNGLGGQVCLHFFLLMHAHAALNIFLFFRFQIESVT